MELMEKLIDEQNFPRLTERCFLHVPGEVKFSLWAEGEIAEPVTVPTPGTFAAVVLDECGTISISYINRTRLFHIYPEINLTSDGISANFS